jgi:hypothetical protein
VLQLFCLLLEKTSRRLRDRTALRIFLVLKTDMAESQHLILRSVVKIEEELERFFIELLERSCWKNFT